MGKRKFEFARKMEKGVVVAEKAYSNAQIPRYSTPYSAGCDFFCAEDTVVPSIHKSRKPTLVHTGIKADMQPDVCLKLYNRSSNPKRGLVLANGVGIIDADYYENESNDGDIMFAFFNITDEDIVIKEGERIGQGIFEAFFMPEEGEIRVGSDTRSGGFGSTGR